MVNLKTGRTITLKEWEHKGYLTLIYDDKTAFVLNVEKLPSKSKLIEESRNVK